VPTLDLAAAVAGAETVVVAIPSQYARSTYASLASLLDPDALLVSATKGLELDTLQRMSEVAAQELPGHPLAVLSGPSFAQEVARGLPTAVVVACARPQSAEALQHAISSRTFRAYASDDVVGVELAGALKNVVAIAAGILDGLGYGHNTAAALITRGLAEMTRLGLAMGAHPSTFAGRAGMGDLVLTCTGDLSRNRSVGIQIGQGRKLAEILGEMRMVAEGVKTTESAYNLARKLGVEMPIIEQMYRMLYENKPAREAVLELMTRNLKAEGA
jgi:glycerol-3-phosphate dehydrogenase (NAD(P)+)